MPAVTGSGGRTTGVWAAKSRNRKRPGGPPRPPTGPKAEGHRKHVGAERTAREGGPAPPADAWACWAEGGAPKQTPETTPSARGGPGTRAPLRFPFPARCQWWPLLLLLSLCRTEAARARSRRALHSVPRARSSVVNSESFPQDGAGPPYQGRSQSPGVPLPRRWCRWRPPPGWVPARPGRGRAAAAGPCPGVIPMRRQRPCSPAHCGPAPQEHRQRVCRSPRSSVLVAVANVPPPWPWPSPGAAPALAALYASPAGILVAGTSMPPESRSKRIDSGFPPGLDYPPPPAIIHR